VQESWRDSTAESRLPILENPTRVGAIQQQNLGFPFAGQKHAIRERMCSWLSLVACAVPHQAMLSAAWQKPTFLF
jgi:hypothetical protein